MIRLSDLCQTLINRSVKVVEYFACNKSEFLIFHSVCLLNSDYKLWDELFFVIELKKKKEGGILVLMLMFLNCRCCQGKRDWCLNFIFLPRSMHLDLIML